MPGFSDLGRSSTPSNPPYDGLGEGDGIRTRVPSFSEITDMPVGPLPTIELLKDRMGMVRGCRNWIPLLYQLSYLSKY